MNIYENYSVLLDLLILMIDSPRGQKIEDGHGWKNDAQALSRKLFHHLSTMQNISFGSTITKKETIVYAFVDHSSIKVVARAALETYLVFHFIYGCPTEDERKFKHGLWHLAGLISRQDYPASTDENKQKLLDEKAQIEGLKDEVRFSKYFCKFTPKQQKALLKGDWRIKDSWQSIGVDAGFHPVYFKMIYNYLCGYSHSSYISALQVGQAQSIEEQERLASGIIQIGLIIMSHFVFSYEKVFNCSSQVLSNNPEAKGIASIWCLKEKDMDAIYGAR